MIHIQQQQHQHHSNNYHAGGGSAAQNAALLPNYNAPIPVQQHPQQHRHHPKVAVNPPLPMENILPVAAPSPADIGGAPPIGLVVGASGAGSVASIPTRDGTTISAEIPPVPPLSESPVDWDGRTKSLKQMMTCVTASHLEELAEYLHVLSTTGKEQSDGELWIQRYVLQVYQLIPLYQLDVWRELFSHVLEGINNKEVLNQRNIENARLAHELEMARKETREKLSRMEEQVQEFQARSKELETQLSKQKNDSAHMKHTKQKYKLCEQSKMELDKKLEQSEVEIARLKAANREQHDHHKQLRRKDQDEIDDLHDQLVILKREKSEFETLASHKSGQLEGLHRELCASEEEMKRRNEEIAKLQNELQRRNEEFVSERTTIDEMVLEFEANLLTRKRHYEEDLEKARTKTRQLEEHYEKKLADMEIMYNRSSYPNDVERLESKLKDEEKRRKAAEDALQDARCRFEEELNLRPSVQQLEMMERNLNEETQKAREMRTKLANAPSEDMLQALQSQLAESENRRREIKCHLEEEERRRREEEKLRRSLERELHDTEHTNAPQKIQDLEERLALKRDIVARLEERLRAAEAENARKDAQLEELKRQPTVGIVHQLQEVLAHMGAQRQELETHLFGTGTKADHDLNSSMDRAHAAGGIQHTDSLLGLLGGFDSGGETAGTGANSTMPLVVERLTNLKERELFAAGTQNRQMQHPSSIPAPGGPGGPNNPKSRSTPPPAPPGQLPTLSSGITDALQSLIGVPPPMLLGEETILELEDYELSKTLEGEITTINEQLTELTNLQAVLRRQLQSGVSDGSPCTVSMETLDSEPSELM
eukprot:TRINITY_DN60168_c0_g1_i1.p1 TRINITY_DN60168_c0_g1~~TRINITY_DN60168_c0_g1_i1.p1  ORF type:complete len:827 (+),score=103.70 TRINITY_DN60168_c0_g1_i1:323-2803(+)